MSDHLSRKQLRTDGFAVAVEHNVEFLSGHRRQVIRYGGIALILIAVGFGIYFYLGHQKAARQEQLADAIQIQESAVTPGAQQPGPLVFTTEDAKRQAAIKAFTGEATAFPGTREGWIAEYYLGCIAADAGKLDEARKRFQAVSDGADKDYASVATYSLAETDYMENRDAEGEKLLRQLIDHPTILMSKEQATIALARHLGKTKPAEARKLLEPIASSPSAASQAAVTVLGEIK